MSEALLPSALGKRLLVLATAVLLIGAIYGCGELQAHEAADDDNYTLDRIQEVGGPIGPPFASRS